MFPLSRPAAWSLVALMACASPWAAAAELSASSASAGSSASVGSASTSLGASSDGSSKATQVAEGDYRILAVSPPDATPGRVQLSLQAEADPTAPPVQLRLPQATLARQGLRVGDRVAALHRPYGLELARAEDRQVFFLVLDDAWFRELTPRAVSL